MVWGPAHHCQFPYQIPVSIPRSPSHHHIRLMNHRWTSHCLTMSSWQGVISVNKAKWWVELFVGPKAYRINSIFIHHQSDDMHYVIHTNPFWARSATLASANIGDSLPNWKRLSCHHTRLVVVDKFKMFNARLSPNNSYLRTICANVEQKRQTVWISKALSPTPTPPHPTSPAE